MLDALLTLAVWPPNAPYSVPGDRDGAALKIAAVVVSLVVVVVAGALTDDSTDEKAGPGRVIDERYRRRRHGR